MAYEISSSVLASSFNTQTVTSAVTNGFEQGGKFSPDGTKLAVGTYRHGGAGSTDYGIDIYTSASVGGWSRTESIDTGTSGLGAHIEWFSDNNIFAIVGTSIKNFVSGASGWSAGQVSVATGGDRYFEFNPSKTILATWKGTDQYYRSIYSGSGNWTSTSDQKGGNYGNLHSLAWISDDVIALGYPENSSYRGILMTQKTTNGGASYSLAEYLNGDSTQLPGMGATLYYHTASNALIVGTRAGAAVTENVKNKLILIQSGSEGHLPASYTSHTVIDSGRRPLDGFQTAPQYGNGDRVLMVTHDDGVDDAELLAIESGSSGWKVTVIDDDIQGPSTEGNIDISSRGAVVSNNIGNGAGQATFVVRQMIAANPALAAFATSSIGSSGGTLSAGGTQASPKITVTVPANALSGDTDLSTEVVSTAATKIQNLHEIKKQAGSADAAFVGDVFRFTPHGQQFSKAVTIQFVLDSEPSDLTIWKRDSHDGDFTQWYELPSNLWSNSGTTVTISTTKFSEYAGIGGINVARTKISNGQLATLTSSDLIDSSALRVSGSNSFKNLTVAAADLFVIEQGGGTYHVSASQMAEYFGGLVTVSASSDNVDMRMTFVSPTDNADIGLAVDAGIKYNPSSNTLKGTNLSGSGDLTIAGNATVDDNLIVTKGYVQVVADNMHITGNVLSSGLIKGTTLSGSGDLTIAGSATIDDNIVVTKGYVHVVSDNVHVTGAVLASGDIKGANISGSSALTIAGSATIDDNIVATKGYIQAAAGGLFVTGAIGLKASNGADAVISTDGGGEIRMDASTNIEIGGVNGTPKIGRSSMTSQVLGHLSGAGNFSLAGNATIDDNIVTTKGYVQVVAGNVHVTGNVLAQEVKGTAISGSGNLTIAGNATIAGDFSVNGDLTYINTTNLAVEDSLILLGSGSSGTPVNDQGFILERGSAANAAVVFDESSDRFAFAYVGTSSAGSTGNLNVALGAPVSASAFYGDGSNLTGVGAATVASNNDNNDLALTFVSGAGLAAATLFTDATALKYNTSTDTLKAVILSASSDITAAGNITADDNIIATKGYVQVKAGNIHLTGAMLASSHISGAGNLSAGGTLAVDGAATLRNSLTVSGGDISGSAGFTLAGSATIDDNLVLTKGYVQVKADNMHVTGNVLASGLIKGSTISGSGDLTIAGSATIDDNAVLTKGYLQIAADNAHVTGAIFATSHVSGGGNFSAAGTLSVAGLISGSSGMDMAGTADFGAAVNVQGLLSGSGGMDMAGTADFGAAVNVQGALDVDGATTLDALTVSEAVTFTSVAALTVDPSDSTHHFLVTDSDDGIVKKETAQDMASIFVTHGSGALGGIKVSGGKMYIAQKEESFMSASLTGRAHTASISSAVLSGSLMVFLNGLLQTRSGSANLGAGANSIFDYRLDSYTAPTEVLMADALDSDDVLIVRYIQK